MVKKTENPSNHVGEVRELEGGGVREEFSREWRGRSEERGWRGRSSTRERAGRGEDEGYNSTGEVAPSPSLLLLLLLLLLLMLMLPLSSKVRGRSRSRRHRDKQTEYTGRTKLRTGEVLS